MLKRPHSKLNRDYYYIQLSKNTYFSAKFKVRSEKLKPRQSLFTFHFKLQTSNRCQGGAEGIRTLDIQLAKLALSQLSYSPIELQW